MERWGLGGKGEEMVEGVVKLKKGLNERGLKDNS